jgi:hypothetical protein
VEGVEDSVAAVVDLVALAEEAAEEAEPEEAGESLMRKAQSLKQGSECEI